MKKEERDNLAARFRRMSEGHKQYQNIYHDGVAEGLLKAAVVVEKMDAWETAKAAGWIKISPAKIYECSDCGAQVMTGDICAYRYCHGCGAKMEGVEDGTD